MGLPDPSLIDALAAAALANVGTDSPSHLMHLARAEADAHLHASIDAATESDYVGTHWLASFALLAASGDWLDGS